MALRKLPQEGTPELEQLVNRWRTCHDAAEMDALARHHGFSYGHSLDKAMRQRGYKKDPIPEPKGGKDPEVVYRTIPIESLHIDRIKPLSKHKGDEEHQVVQLGDAQVGHSTRSYNSGVYLRRMKNFERHTMLIANLHRNLYPLNELWIIFEGDNVQGEKIGKQVALDELDTMVDKHGTRHVMTVTNQIHDILVPATVSCIANFLQLYRVVHLRGVRGNHGTQEKWNANRSNWDAEYYRSLEMAFLHEKRVDVDFEYDDFFQIVEIQGWKFFVFHGDQIPSHHGIPWYGIERRVLNWKAIYNFDFVLMGHFHTFGEHDCNGIPIFLNGTFCSDDAWALKKLGKKGSLAQRTFGVHKNVGVTWRYPVLLEKVDTQAKMAP